MSSKEAPLWRRERLGLSMIAASLVVIGALCVFLYDRLVDERRYQLQAKGVELLRVLSTLPLDELAPASNPASILRTLSLGDGDGALAYAVLTQPDGSTLSESVSRGLVVPTWRPPADPSAWFGERPVEADAARPALIEYYAPILKEGEHAAHLRLGYFRPGASALLSGPTVSLFATLALLVFLLTPLFYLLVRREIRPLTKAAQQIQTAVHDGAMPQLTVDAGGELGQFMSSFNQFVDYANARIASMATENERVITSTQLLSYRNDRVLRVLESLPDAILVLDDSGAITVANQRLESLLGVDVSTLSGDRNLEWCEQPVVRQFLGQCRHRATRRYLPDPVEFKIDGRLDQTYSIAAHPIFATRDSAASGCVVLIRDTTAQALAKAGRAQFVAHVAHELKTPLNVLSMYSQSLQCAEPDDHALQIEAANVIEDEVQRLSALINNLLSLTKIEMGSLDLDRHRVRIGDLLTDAMDTARHIRGAETLTLKLELPSTLGALNLDKDLLRIVLNNLLSNAIKYNRPDGTVTLSALEDDSTLSISVTDTGIGIAAEDLPKVFDKFYRSDSTDVRDRSGHGLGLALARDIVELHNGSLTVQSTVGEGTTFTLTLMRQMHEVRDVG